MDCTAIWTRAIKEVGKAIIEQSVVGKNKMSEDLLKQLRAAIEEYQADGHAQQRKCQPGADGSAKQHKYKPAAGAGI